MIRDLSLTEEANLGVIRSFVDDVAFLFLTPTGMKKALLDAVLPVRTLLKRKGLHDYSIQAQGQDNKVVLKACLLGDTNPTTTVATLYRPETKKGDPRIWFSRLGNNAAAGDVLVLFVHGGMIHFLNLTRSTLHSLKQTGIATETIAYIDAAHKNTSEIANELLSKLRNLATGGPLRAVCMGDTSVGRTIESALGIPINSSKTPDYKGIEIKSARSKSIHGTRKNRATLFAQVPDWAISRYKSSRELLDEFGYDRSGIRKLYCTIAVGQPNSQGLQLELLRGMARLAEVHPASKPQDVVLWDLDHLHARLLQKHRETFWIAVESVEINSHEHFVLKSVKHTINPSPAQFDDLLGDGHITVDHLIKRMSGRVTEKGPLFKLPQNRISSLFVAQPRFYTL